MDISFKVNDTEKFNYRVCAIIIHDGKVLAMHDERSPYFYLPGGRVKMFERAEDALTRELKEELGIISRIIRPLWLNQSFFNEDVDHINYHELCIYFLVEILDSDLLNKDGSFMLYEGSKKNTFEWLEFARLANEYFYPDFLKESIFHLPVEFTIRTEKE